MKSCSKQKTKIFSMQTMYILFLLPLASCLARKVKRCPIWEGEKVVSSFTISSSRMSTNLVVTASKSNYKKHFTRFHNTGTILIKKTFKIIFNNSLFILCEQKLQSDTVEFKLPAIL